MVKQGSATATATKPLQPLYGDSPPYTIEVGLLGVTPFLFNQFADLEGYAEEGVSGKKKPANRKRHDYEQMVWRDDDGKLALPTQNVISSICVAGRYFKSPIGSSGSARNTLSEGLIPAAQYASFGSDDWDAIDFRLARNGDMKRSPKPTWRPRLEIGWQCTVHIGVISPEFFTPTNLAEIIGRAGASCGVGDGRKIGMGRFITNGVNVAEGLPW